MLQLAKQKPSPAAHRPHWGEEPQIAPAHRLRRREGGPAGRGPEAGLGPRGGAPD